MTSHRPVVGLEKYSCCRWCASSFDDSSCCWRREVNWIHCHILWHIKYDILKLNMFCACKRLYKWQWVEWNSSWNVHTSRASIAPGKPPARFSSMLLGIKTNHARVVPTLLAENGSVHFPGRGSDVVWIKKVRVEQGGACMHPHRQLLHWLTAQWSGKQPFRVSRAFFLFFCFFVFVCVGLVADWGHVIICFGGGFVRARSVFHRIRCHGRPRSRATGELSCVAVGFIPREGKLVWIFEWFSLSLHIEKRRKKHLISSSGSHVCKPDADEGSDGSKPQALPWTTLLCNSRSKAIIHGACQTGLALSHNHTCIGACVIVSTYVNAHRSRGKMCTLDGSDEPLWRCSRQQLLLTRN